jgi:hypothetical protein
MDKIVRLGEGKWGSVYCRIKINDGNLSIVGVEGPKANGDALGSCGQLILSGINVTDYAHGWTRERVEEFANCWSRWHLNDMRAECSHQRERGETWKTHPRAVCPECSYRLGTAWLKEELPEEVVTFLDSLPPADIKPAWV